MTHVVTELIVSYVSDHANLLESFVVTYTALVSCLFNIIGLEFGAHLVQTATELFDKTASSIRTSNSINNNEQSGVDDNLSNDASVQDDVTSKRMLNLATFISSLYNFDVIGCPLIYDIVRMCLARLEEVDVETLLRVLRVCGQKMRSEDPASLKDIVQLVHEESTKGNPVFSK
jgi:nucleolar MIF4G domain-containing protein 1